MSINTFSKSAKEIIVTSIVALFIFSFLASFDANAKSNDDIIYTSNNTEYSQPTQQLSKLIALVMHLENDVITSNALLNDLEIEFEANKISAQDIFMAVLTHQQIQDALAKAKVELVIELNHVANEKQMTNIIAKK